MFNYKGANTALAEALERWKPAQIETAFRGAFGGENWERVTGQYDLLITRGGGFLEDGLDPILSGQLSTINRFGFACGGQIGLLRSGELASGAMIAAAPALVFPPATCAKVTSLDLVCWQKERGQPQEDAFERLQNDYVRSLVGFALFVLQGLPLCVVACLALTACGYDPHILRPAREEDESGEPVSRVRVDDDFAEVIASRGFPYGEAGLNVTVAAGLAGLAEFAQLAFERAVLEALDRSLTPARSARLDWLVSKLYDWGFAPDASQRGLFRLARDWRMLADTSSVASRFVRGVHLLTIEKIGLREFRQRQRPARVRRPQVQVVT